MISNYEIRENSITQNSVYILLVKADEKGREDIERELADHCKLIEGKVKGFDYVFELSDITDEASLEKIRTRIDFISSSVLGVTQTFGNLSNTATIDMPTNISVSKYGIKPEKTSFPQEEVNNKEKSSINLANTGFPLTNEPPDETNFKDIPVDSTLISGDEKRIEIGENSLKLEKTMTDVNIPKSNKNMPSILDISPKKEANMTDIKGDLSDVEMENKTIVSYSPQDMKGVSMSIDKEKKGFIGNIFGKIKSAVNSNKKQDKSKKNNSVSKKESPFSSLMEDAKELKQEMLKEFDKKETKTKSVNEEKNPFQDLGEGIIVKKGMLDDETNITAVQKELSVDAVKPQLQVDDIFAAETICNFYDNSSDGQEHHNKTTSIEGKTPLDILKETSVKEESDDKEENLNIPEKEETNSSNVLQKSVDHDNQESIQDKNDITLPEQIFTEEIKQPVASSVNNEDLSSVNDRDKEEKPLVTDENSSKNQTIKKDVNKKEEDVLKKRILQEESKPMQVQNKVNMIKEKHQNNSQDIHKTAFVQNPTKKAGMKIDHTLHVAAPSKNTKYRNYPIEMPLIPTYTFANMDISSIRFAHALAMATLDDLGNNNNPFLLQGSEGTGKTHFLHAMGYEISKKIPQAKILFTNGVRFSRGVQYLLEQGQQEKLDAFFTNAEVLIIDDVHLTAVNEHNREYISKVLNDFLKDKKQIILSSKYPPESLKRFEELVNFKFSAGTIAELKVPNTKHFEKLTSKIVTSSFLDLTEKQVQTFFTDRLSSLGDVARDVKRVKVLSRRIESSGIKKMSYEDILKEITSVNGENEESDIVKKDFSDITVLERNKGISWGNFGFFFPASQIDKFRWVAFAAQEAAKELGIKGGFSYSLKSSYSTEHIISAAFKIANICDLKGLKGAIILGPAFVECPEPIRDNFYDILTHMLEVMMIRCGTINFEDIKKPSAYVKLLGDILK